MHIVDQSTWLMDRHAYEKLHYGQTYDADEMLREYSHYVFSFHDEFVEAIAAGIWFEEADDRIGNVPLLPGHPLLDIPAECVVDVIEAHGIRCQVRENPLDQDALVRHAGLCSQKVYQFAAELDGGASVSWTLDLRDLGGRLQSFLRGYFGKAEDVFEGVASLAAVEPFITTWLAEVRKRRDAMGKR